MNEDAQRMQASRLEAENRALRQQLEALLREARSNEDKMRRFEQLEHRLIGARSIVELVHLLLVEYRRAFDIEFVTLTLIDGDLEATRILDTELREDAGLKGLSLVQSGARLNALYGQNYEPRLGPFDGDLHGPLFDPVSLASIGSVALLPLSRHGALIGSLHFGSRNRQRYEAAAGTHFLERLSGIVAVCIDSALNQERLKLAGLTDALTGVHNRRYFEHRCQVEIAQARRYRHPLACMFLDIDQFKRINDTHGHQSGDEVLRTVGHAIQGQLRAGDTIARYGGEEFVVLLPQTPVHHAREIAERIRLSIAGRPTVIGSGESLAATISIGLAMLPGELGGRETADLAGQLVAEADKALYQAKHRGRNRVVCA
jgi:two-component system, cell cycle response regulator